MPGFNGAFKSEVGRLARKEIRDVVGSTMKASAQYRREIASLKKEVSTLQKKIAFLEGREAKRLTSKPAATKAPTGVRFSARQVKAHRDRLGLSAREYALLVGVSQLTIYNWESGKSRPQQDKLAAWAAIRDIGVREAQRRLEVIEA